MGKCKRPSVLSLLRLATRAALVVSETQKLGVDGLGASKKEEGA